MKKLILLMLFTVCAIVARSQSPNQAGYTGVYKWTDVVLMQPCDAKGNLMANIPVQYSIVGSKFTVYDVENGTVTLKMYDYTERAKSDDKNASKSNSSASSSSTISNGKRLFKVEDLFYKYNFEGSPHDYDTLAATSANTRNYGSRQIYFKVPLTTFTKSAQKITEIAQSFNLGAINFPFKYRLSAGRGDFSGGFNLGAAVGYQFKHDSLSKFTFTIPIAISISSVNIDSVSAIRNQALLKSTNNFTALSGAIGGIIENNKIQIGVFIGFDKLSRINNVQYGWIYQNKPWISIGFGYSLFSSEKPATSGSTDTQQTTTQ